MSDEPPFSRQELERRGLYDPDAADGPERLELIRYVLSLGATVEEVTATPNLGQLALDLNLRPRGPLTIGQVIAPLPIEWQAATRLLTALGMATDGDEPITAEEAAAIRLFARSTEILGEESAVQLARVTASAMAKVAETLVAAFRIQVEIPRLESGVRSIDMIREYSDITHSLLPSFVHSLDALLRQQILAVARRMWSTDEERSTVTLWRTGGSPGRSRIPLRPPSFPAAQRLCGLDHPLTAPVATWRPIGAATTVTPGIRPPRKGATDERKGRCHDYGARRHHHRDVRPAEEAQCNQHRDVGRAVGSNECVG